MSLVRHFFFQCANPNYANVSLWLINFTLRNKGYLHPKQRDFFFLIYCFASRKKTLCVTQVKKLPPPASQVLSSRKQHTKQMHSWQWYLKKTLFPKFESIPHILCPSGAKISAPQILKLRLICSASGTSLQKMFGTRVNYYYRLQFPSAVLNWGNNDTRPTVFAERTLLSETIARATWHPSTRCRNYAESTAPFAFQLGTAAIWRYERQH